MFEWLADRFYRWRHDRRRGRPWERGPRARGLFPAYADWGGGMAVDRAGEVWYAEEPAGWAARGVVAEPDIRFAALAVAVLRHPEIAHLAPVRTAGDPACPTCHGRGYPAQLPPKLRYWIVCQCGGLGWVPTALANRPRTDRTAGDIPPVA